MSKNQEALVGRADTVLREFSTIHDIPLQVAIEVGRLSLSVRDLMKLSPDSIIELKKPAGEPFDICINGVRVARGEVIVVEQSSGVRIIEIRDPGSQGQ